VAGVLAYLGARGLGDGRVEPRRLAFDTSCDLRAEPCRLAFGDGRSLTFSIEPRAIPLMQPLNLRVTTAGMQPASLTVDILGLNMDMGLNRTRLKREPEGDWSGRTILPVCSRSRMEWEAQVRIDLPGSDAELIAPFRFNTTR
jgi:hypothetical protein